MAESTQVLIIGAGFGGIGMAISLQRAGTNDFIVIEKESDVGGTWRDNTYPGSACDTESHLYCFSFAPHTAASRIYARQPELLAYIHRLVEDHSLRDQMRFNTEVRRLDWNGVERHWVVSLSDGSVIFARNVVAAWGQLNRPKTPVISGASMFAGETFHSARWRHDLSLKGKRVASIGNAASAIQYIPEIVPEVAHLTVFQRSPNWIVPRLDRPYTEDELRVFSAIPGQFDKSRKGIFDFREGMFERMLAGSASARALQEVAHAHLRSQIQNPELRAKLTPDYPIGCKRVLRSDDYYPALAQPNVHLATDAVKEIVAEGIVTADGMLHELDVIIYGTGFETHSFMGGIEIIGANGKDLREFWDGEPRAYLGIEVPEFPNFHMLYGPNTNLGHNSILQMLESQFSYICQIIGYQLEMGVPALTINEEVFVRFDRRVQKEIEASAWAGNCNSWYKSKSGRVINNWSGTVRQYQAAAAKFDPSEFVPV